MWCVFLSGECSQTVKKVPLGTKNVFREKLSFAIETFFSNKRISQIWRFVLTPIIITFEGFEGVEHEHENWKSTQNPEPRTISQDQTEQDRKKTKGQTSHPPLALLLPSLFFSYCTDVRNTVPVRPVHVRTVHCVMCTSCSPTRVNYVIHGIKISEIYFHSK